MHEGIGIIIKALMITSIIHSLFYTQAIYSIYTIWGIEKNFRKISQK